MAKMNGQKRPGAGSVEDVCGFRQLISSTRRHLHAEHRGVGPLGRYACQVRLDFQEEALPRTQEAVGRVIVIS